MQLCSKYEQLPGTGYNPWQPCGHLWIGGYDPNFVFNSTMYFVPIIQTSYFTIRLFGINVGSAGSVPGIASPGPAIVDSGTSYLILSSKKSFQGLVNLILQSGMLSDPSLFPPDSELWNGTSRNCVVKPNGLVINQHVSVTFRLENVNIQVPPSNFFVTMPGANCGQKGGSSCICFCVGYNTKNRFTILGAPFMMDLVVFFDRGSSLRLGFGTSKNCGMRAQSPCEFGLY